MTLRFMQGSQITNTGAGNLILRADNSGTGYGHGESRRRRRVGRISRQHRQGIDLLRSRLTPIRSADRNTERTSTSAAASRRLTPDQLAAYMLVNSVADLNLVSTQSQRQIRARQEHRCRGHEPAHRLDIRSIRGRVRWQRRPRRQFRDLQSVGRPVLDHRERQRRRHRPQSQSDQRRHQRVQRNSRRAGRHKPWCDFQCFRRPAASAAATVPSSAKSSATISVRSRIRPQPEVSVAADQHRRRTYCGQRNRLQRQRVVLRRNSQHPLRLRRRPRRQQWRCDHKFLFDGSR